MSARLAERLGNVEAWDEDAVVRWFREELPRLPPATIEDCLQEASPAGARYQLWGSILAQVGDTTDGLAAIQKLIYEDRTLAWDQLVAALEADYQGYEGLRQMIRNRAPKYGNDDDYADAWALKTLTKVHNGTLNQVRDAWGYTVTIDGSTAAGFQSIASTP